MRLEMIAAKLSAEPKTAHELPKEGDIRLSEANVSLARELIGYEPAVRMDECIRTTPAWFRDHAPLAR